MSNSDRKKAQKIVDKYQAEFIKKYNVLQEQSAHGVNIVRTSIWAKMSYEEKLEYEYCMALKQKLSMNNKVYAAGYGLINSIPFLPEMNTLIYNLLMDKKDPKVYADSPEGRLKNADIQSDGWCTKGEAIGDIAQVVVPFAWAKLSKAGECVKGVEVASEGEKSVALAEEGIGVASKVEKTAKVTSEVDEAAKVTSKAGKITKGVSKVDEAASSNVGGKVGESINELKATKSESEIAKLEKPKVKEAKPKDVEVEKVGKTEAKFKKSKTKFSSENEDINSIFKNGKVKINDLKANPSVFRGKSVNEIAQVLKENGYDVTVKASTRSRSGAQIIKINNPGNGKNISQVQVSPGGGRHGKETSTIIFSGGN